MKAKKALILFLTLCLAVSSVLCLGVSAEGTEEAGKGLSTGAIVSLCIAGALVVLAVVLCIIKREKVKESLKSYKSEMKKIVWYSREQTVHSSIVVIVCIVFIGAVIAALDFGFSHLLSWIAALV